jgi:hypothetical protein
MRFLNCASPFLYLLVPAMFRGTPTNFHATARLPPLSGATWTVENGRVMSEFTQPKIAPHFPKPPTMKACLGGFENAFSSLPPSKASVEPLALCSSSKIPLCPVLPLGSPNRFE